MSPMTMYSHNAADTRRWARTEKEPREAGRPQEGAPTREDEQRYSQTTPQPNESRENDAAPSNGNGDSPD